MKPFTKEEGLKVQAQQLAEWRARLNAECYVALVEFITKKNEQLEPTSVGYDVTRGTDMDNFIHNWR